MRWASGADERASERLVGRGKNPVKSALGNVHRSGDIGRRQLPLGAALPKAILNALTQ
jgi:hypothetical protein